MSTSTRTFNLADLFEVLVVIDLVAIVLFDLILLALRITTILRCVVLLPSHSLGSEFHACRKNICSGAGGRHRPDQHFSD